jgi:hypothetical protein
MAGQKREARLRADVPAIHVLSAADIANLPPRHCLRQTRSVCAREQSDEAIHLSPRGKVDCFAALAMTISQLVLENVDGRDKPGHNGG